MTTYLTTGSVAVTNGSAAVTGTDTDWATALVTAGMFYCQGGAYPIDEVISNTSLTLKLPYAGATGTGLDYAIGRSEAIQEQTVMNANRLAGLLAVFPVFSPFALEILDDADALSVRDTIGAQAASAKLTSFAGVAGAANKLAYFTGADAFGVTDLSAFGRSLIDDADAAGALATLRASAVAKTSAYTIVAGDIGRLVLCAGTFALTLTAAATLGSGFSFAVRNAGGGIVTVTPAGGDLINGMATLAILPGQDCRIICDGDDFHTVGLQRVVETRISVAAASEMIIPLADGYRRHEIHIEGIVPASDAQLHMQFSTDGGVSYINSTIARLFTLVDVGGADPFVNGSNFADTKIQLTGTQKSATVSPIVGDIVIDTPLAGYNKSCRWNLKYYSSSSVHTFIEGSGEVPTTTRLTHVRLFHPSINMAAGAVTLRSFG